MLENACGCGELYLRKKIKRVVFEKERKADKLKKIKKRIYNELNK